MKSIIRKILIEDSKLNKLKKYFINMWNDQVRSGKIPMLNIVDLERKKLSTYIDEITKWYLEFVGGKDKAFELFDQYITNLKVTDKDLRNSYQNIHSNDHFEVMITRSFEKNYMENGELEFGFYIINGTFDTSDGQLTYEELMDDHYDDIFWDVENWLRGEIEGYVHTIQLNFGLNYLDVTSLWDD
jgi:hypothetical protein